ncbi:unnamed protein product, partial [Fusarium fujikuroi]
YTPLLVSRCYEWFQKFPKKE